MNRKKHKDVSKETAEQTEQRLIRRKARKALRDFREDLINTRTITKDSKEVVVDDVFYTHFPLDEGSVATVAAVEDENGFIHYGLSFCNPADQFSRKHGREDAFRNLRYTANRHGVVTPEDKPEDLPHNKFSACKVALETELKLNPPHWYSE